MQTGNSVQAGHLEKFAIGLKDIQAAAGRIGPHIVCTPTLPCPHLAAVIGSDVRLKCENLQYGSAFKARGAVNAVLNLSAAAAAAGVVTHSSGNHAAALARAAVLRGIRAHIVMPENSSPIKLAAVRDLGVEPILCGPTATEREAAAERVRIRTGATMVHPYDHPDVIAGQGTVGLEMLAQFPEVQTVIVPVGGGGLLAGTLLALKSLRPDVRVVAAEPARADDAARSLASGTIEQPLRFDSVADGLRTPLGQLTFPVIRDLLDEILLVDDDEILDATRRLLWQCRLVAEPSGAVTVAALLRHHTRFAGQQVAAVISGGNLNPAMQLTG